MIKISQDPMLILINFKSETNNNIEHRKNIGFCSANSTSRSHSV